MSRPDPTPAVPHADPVAHALHRVAWLMDRSFTVPGTKVQFGLDALLGLLPLGGDVMTGLVQTALILVALRRYHVPKAVAARMVGNVLLDIGVGAIPLIGDLFDVAFKANTRNMHLLDPYLEPYLEPSRPKLEPARSQSPWTAKVARAKTSWGFLLAIALVLVGVLLLMLVGFITVVHWLLQGPGSASAR